MRRPINRGELGSRRLVMLIFAGCSGLATRPIRHSFNSPQPLSNSLGDACLGWIKSSLNANETSWVGYRDLPPQIRSLLVCACVFALTLRVVSPFLFVSLFPSNYFSDRWGLRLVARLRAQEFPDKAAELPRDGHDRLVALEAARQQTCVATVQPVLCTPTDGPHLR